MQEQAQFRWRSPAEALVAFACVGALVALSMTSGIVIRLMLIPLIGYGYIFLILYGHEAVHGNLSRHGLINNLIGRFFCCYPVARSFAQFQKIHLAHHKYLGSDLDHDRPAYATLPLPKYTSKVLRLAISGKLFWFSLKHYSTPKKIARSSFNSTSLNAIKRDCWGLLSFWLIILATVIFFQAFAAFVFGWLLPMALITQPYVLFLGAIQHGRIDRENDKSISRTITDNSILMNLLLPLNLRFHGEHHCAPNVPYFNLPKVRRKTQSLVIEQTFQETMCELFSVERRAQTSFVSPPSAPSGS